jgi:hypothetical protein
MLQHTHKTDVKMKILLIIPNELLISSDVVVPKRHNYNAKIAIWLSEVPLAAKPILINGKKTVLMTAK